MNIVASFVEAVESASDRFGQLDGRYLLPALALQLLTLVFRALALARRPGRRLPGASYPGHVRGRRVRGRCRDERLHSGAGRRARQGPDRPHAHPRLDRATLAASLSVVLIADAVIGGLLVCTLWGTGVLPALPAPPGLGALEIIVAAALAVGARARDRVQAQARPGTAARRSGGAGRQHRPQARPVPLHGRAFPARSVVLPDRRRLPRPRGLRHPGEPGDSRPRGRAERRVHAGSRPRRRRTQQVLATYALQGAVSAATAVSFSLGMQVGVTAVNTTVGLVAMMLLFRTVRPLGAVRSAVRSSAARRDAPVAQPRALARVPRPLRGCARLLGCSLARLK